MDCINWWEKLIDFIVAFVATGLATCLGVFLALYFDRRKETKKVNERRVNLLKGLLMEVQEIQKVIAKTPSLIIHSNFQLPSSIMENTVKDQIDLLDNLLIKDLTEFRYIISDQNKNLFQWEQLAAIALGAGQAPDQRRATMAGQIQASWQSFLTSVKDPLPALISKLEQAIKDQK